MHVLTKLHLLKALKQANDESLSAGGPAIPYSHKSLIKLEKLGIIKVEGIEYENRPGITRFYSESEVKNIVEKVRKYVLKNNEKHELD